MHAPKFLRPDSGKDFPHPRLRVPLTTRLSYVFWWFVVPLLAGAVDVLLLPVEWMARGRRRRGPRPGLALRHYALIFATALALFLVVSLMLRREDFVDFMATADPELNDRDALIEVLDSFLPESGLLGDFAPAPAPSVDDPDLLMPEP